MDFDVDIRFILTQARHPPYPLPIMYAEKAREVMTEALAKGLTPPKNVWSSLMDAQVRKPPDAKDWAPLK